MTEAILNLLWNKRNILYKRAKKSLKKTIILLKSTQNLSTILGPTTNASGVTESDNKRQYEVRMYI